jgi:hypothetical protein
MTTGSLSAKAAGTAETRFAIHIRGIRGEPSDAFCVAYGSMCVSDLELSQQRIEGLGGSCDLEPRPRGEPDAVIPVDGECFLRLGFRPSVAADFEAMLLLQPFTGGEPSVGILTGRGTRPVADISPDVGEFEAEGDREDFRIDNVGTEAVELEPLHVPPGFDLVPPGSDLVEKSCAIVGRPEGVRVLKPGASCEFTIILEDAQTSELMRVKLSPKNRVKGDIEILLVVKS